MSTNTVEAVSKAWVKPHLPEIEAARQTLAASQAMDMCMMKLGNHKRFLIFQGVHRLDLEHASVRLKDSLSVALQKRYPLAGKELPISFKILNFAVTMPVKRCLGRVAGRLMVEQDGTYAISCKNAGVLFLDVGSFANCRIDGVNGFDVALNFNPDLSFVHEEPEGYPSAPLFSAQVIELCPSSLIVKNTRGEFASAPATTTLHYIWFRV